METKVCSCCGVEKPITEFRNVGKKNGGVVQLSVCSDCMKKKQSEGRKRAYAKEQQEKVAQIEILKKTRLSEFTPRELMEELKRRGYEGKLHYTEVREIDFCNI